MANPTIFQRLNKVFSNGVNSATSASYTQNTENNLSQYQPNDVIFSTNSKEEYDYESARLRQQRLLAKQWKRASYEVSNNEPSARNVLKEKTALAAFLTNEFCPNTDKDIKDITKQIVKYRSVFMLC